MKSFQTTMFVLLGMVLSTQTCRHVYVKWIEPRGSVLDEFRDPVERGLADVDDLADLRDRYAKAHAEAQAYESSRGMRDVDLARRTDQPVFEAQRELREAIERVEAQDRARFQLWFYWLVGLASIAAGLVAYARLNPWVGMVGILTGFVEMAVWTSPLWRSWGPQRRFDELLTLKLVLSLASVALLLTVWLWNERHARAVPPSAAA